MMRQPNGWAQLARQYIALQKPALLEQAVQAADTAGETAIAQLLRAFQQRDEQSVDTIAAALLPALQSAGRTEEAQTVRLIALFLRAALVERFKHFPLELQAQMWEVGLQACEQSLRIARALNDLPCVAFYFGLMGRGYYHARRYGEAVAVYQEALALYRELAQQQPEVYTPEVARTLTNLGVALDELRRYDEAVAAYQEALALYRELAQQQPEVYIPDVAMTLNNLGNALRSLRRYDEAEQAYREAQALLQNYDAPDLKAKLLSNLGQLLMAQARWVEAIKALEEAVQQVEQLRTEALSLERRETVMRENLHIFENLILCLMREGRYERALEVAEQGKSRTLIDLLTLRDLRPQNAPPELVAEYEQMLFRARALEDALRRDGRDGQLDDGQSREERMAQLQQERREAMRRLDELVAQIRQHDPDFLPHAKPLNLTQIRALAQKAQSTLLLFRVTDEGSFAFLVYPDEQTEVVSVPDFTTERLYELLVRFEDGEAVDGWVARYYAYQKALALGDRGAIGQARQRWLEGMDATLGVLYEELVQPVHARLQQKRVRSLVIVPNKGLAILPLHACWWEENGARRYLMDECEVRYAPSLTIFHRCCEREQAGRNRETLLGVVNPDPPGDLTASEWEGEAIERRLGNARCLMLWRDQATESEVRRWLQGRGYLHFACHGQYRLDNPLESALQLAGDTLTLGEILEGVHLPQAWLVVLSACETGLVDFREIADEHYGLPVGFLYAGAPTVYGSLWTVNDLSTALLMMKAYELLEVGKPKGAALREAQLWLRDLTAGEALALVRQKEAELREERLAWVDIAPMRRVLESQNPTERPFAHPYHWAGFQCVGV